jgi:tryptophanyl-tRNA synthetase
MQMEGMMQQMGGMMEHMADRIQAGPMTPEQTKQMSEVMRHIADMINNSYGMRGAETPQQILNMMERMTEMHKRLMSVIAAPQLAPQQK